jgi:hypothetical protein
MVEEARRAARRPVLLGLSLLLAAGPWAASGAAAQDIFDHMKCYKIKDTQRSKLYTADLAPKLTHDFQLEPGDTIVGGTTIKGCRIKVPAKYFCIDVDKQDAHDVDPPYDPAQWTVPGPESGERLCYALKCPDTAPKSLAIIDQFGTREIFLLGKTSFLCTPVTRQNPSTDPCEMDGSGQCGGVCGPGEMCLATSGEECSCAPADSFCPNASSCGSGLCGGVWETCVTIPGVGCGCSHP